MLYKCQGAIVVFEDNTGIVEDCFEDGRDIENTDYLAVNIDMW